jgi:hypothetical protein
MRLILPLLSCAAAMLLSGCSMFDTANIAGDKFVVGPHTQRCTGLIESVEDTGTTINDDPVARLTLTVTPPQGPTYGSTIDVLVSRLTVPQLGDVLDVSCDPDNPKNTKVID